MTIVEQHDERGEYIAGLRALADLMDVNPALVGDVDGQREIRPFQVFVDTKAEAAAWARALADVTKTPARGSDNMLIEGMAGPLFVRVWVARDEVCTRVVTGTREVVKTVPAPDAPTVEITETVEDVTWVCEPLLAEATR